MKYVGLLLIIVGIFALLYFVSLLIIPKQTIHSPIPEDKGIKVIFISPSTSR